MGELKRSARAQRRGKSAESEASKRNLKEGTWSVESEAASHWWRNFFFRSCISGAIKIFKRHQIILHLFGEIFHSKVTFGVNGRIPNQTRKNLANARNLRGISRAICSCCSTPSLLSKSEIADNPKAPRLLASERIETGPQPGEVTEPQFMAVTWGTWGKPLGQAADIKVALVRLHSCKQERSLLFKQEGVYLGTQESSQNCQNSWRSRNEAELL